MECSNEKKWKYSLLIHTLIHSFKKNLISLIICFSFLLLFLSSHFFFLSVFQFTWYGFSTHAFIKVLNCFFFVIIFLEVLKINLKKKLMSFSRASSLISCLKLHSSGVSHWKDGNPMMQIPTVMDATKVVKVVLHWYVFDDLY